MRVDRDTGRRVTTKPPTLVGKERRWVVWVVVVSCTSLRTLPRIQLLLDELVVAPAVALALQQRSQATEDLDPLRRPRASRTLAGVHIGEKTSTQNLSAMLHL